MRKTNLLVFVDKKLFKVHNQNVRTRWSKKMFLKISGKLKERKAPALQVFRPATLFKRGYNTYFFL